MLPPLSPAGCRPASATRILIRAAQAAVLVLAAAIPALGAGNPPPAPPVRFPHVRSVERDVLRLLARGSRDSATFRQIVNEIERSDVIVYVQTVPILPPPARAWLQFGAVAGGHRYLRISVARPVDAYSLIALVGHELHHVTEVIRAPEVISVETFRALYQRLGHASQNGYDTPDARAVGLAVFDELARSRVPSSPLDSLPSGYPPR